MIKKSCVPSERTVEGRAVRREPATTDERVKSCFSKKAGQSQQPNFRHQNIEDVQQDCEQRERPPSNRQGTKRGLKTESKELMNEAEGGSGRSSDERITTSPQGDDCVKEISKLVMTDCAMQDPSQMEAGQEFPEVIERGSMVQDEMLSQCSVEELKQMKCQMLNDCDFFDPDENSRGAGRLLFLEYQEKELYINESKARKSPGKGKIPDYIVSAFRDSRRSATLDKSFFALNSKELKPTTIATARRDHMRTEETYDTSNPSNSQHYTPNSLTPRSSESFFQPTAIRERRASNHNAPVPPMQTIISMNLEDSSPTDMTQHTVPVSETSMDMSMEVRGMQQANYDYYQQYEYYQQKLKTDGGMQNSNRKRRIISFEESKNYIIDLEKIEIDGRTTIMIRNIPNKYTQEMLLQLIHRTHGKKYDFFYLPIDYTNSCNMGYAFINFLHTKFIPDFYHKFDGKRWEMFNSEKICSLTYARIQGTVSLMNHFQNSNVMYQRHRKTRPLIDVSHSLVMSDLSTIIERQRQEQDH